MRIAGAALPLVLVAGLASAAPIPVTGHWLVEDGTAIVDVAPCGAELCGRIARVVKPKPGAATTDVNNPDPSQRSRPVQGMTILSGFVAAGNRWKGRVYDPRSGRTYRSELTREGGTLHVKGCLGPFCRTIDWTHAG